MKCFLNISRSPFVNIQHNLKSEPTTLLQFQKVKLKKNKESKCIILKDKEEEEEERKTLWSRVIIHTETTHDNFLRRIKGLFIYLFICVKAFYGYPIFFSFEFTV